MIRLPQRGFKERNRRAGGKAAPQSHPELQAFFEAAATARESTKLDTRCADRTL
jgi:hypothetical protein